VQVIISRHQNQPVPLAGECVYVSYNHHVQRCTGVSPNLYDSRHASVGAPQRMLGTYVVGTVLQFAEREPKIPMQMLTLPATCT